MPRRCEEEGDIYLTPHWHLQNDFSIRTGSDESYLNVKAHSPIYYLE